MAYRSLVNSLFTRSRRAGPELNANLAAIVAALNRMTAELPDSRFGRIATAIIHARGGRYEDAEAMLRAVLAADPDEPDALVPLAQVVGLMGRSAEGVAILESALKRKAQLDVVRSLASIFRDLDRKADALTLLKRYADENPDSESYALLYVTELTTQEKPGEAAAALAAARARFPRSQAVVFALARLQDDADDHELAVATMRNFMKAGGETTERLYLLSHFYSTSGNDDASVAALQRVLAIMPDNLGANNDLGYFWVNAGIHLEQAEPMIRKALENKPEDPAFLDSLAWLNYKRGKFADAAALLQKALALPNGMAPEVVRHFGDALYRMGREPEAVEQWAKALQMLAISEKLTPADRKEREYLTQAVTEARAGRVPEVSPVVEAESTKAAGAVPATMP
jgi:tetratricopeptide (TPR) repeat protein